MKTSFLSTITLFIVLSACQQADKNETATNNTAKMGEKVWFCAYHVKADKKQQYENFVHDIFWAGASKLSEAEQKVFRQTRILHPEKAEADGTFFYAFLMNPQIEGADYSIESLLKKMYGEKQGTEYFNLFKDSLTDGLTEGKDDIEYYMVQSKD